MAVTILDVAIAKGMKQENGSISMGAFNELNLPFFAGCEQCAASLGPAQSFPSTTGNIRCRQCIGPLGFETVQEFDRWCEAQEAYE